MKDSTFDVIVVGAGMVGASAALMLARKGYSVAVIERASIEAVDYQLNEEFDQRVSAISPASESLLQQLNVWPEILAQRACAYQKMTVWHENGGVSMHFASEQMAQTHLGHIVENRLIQQVLLRQLQLMSNVTLLGGQTVTEIFSTTDQVELKTSDGTGLVAHLLLAADGRESTVAQLMGLSKTAGSYQQNAIVANVSTEKPHQNTAWQRFLSTGPLAFLPLSNGQSSIVWSADCERAQQIMHLDDNAFMAQLGKAFELRLGKITATSQRVAFPLGWHSADQWLSGRALLIGDAAHGVHPLAGQGVNLGFGDVALLNQMLTSGDEVYKRALLRRFERQRKAQTVTAMHLFSALKLIYAQQNPLGCLVRDFGMSMVENNPVLKRLVVQNALQNMA